MAQQSIVNVDSRVGQSVVDSTTDVDVSKTVSSATSGGNTEENFTRTSTRDPGSTKATEEGTESGGSVMLESNKAIDESRTQTPAAGGELVDSDLDIGSGSGSPTKVTGVEGTAKPTLRTSVKKPQSFKAVSINKHFLEKTSATGTSNTPTKVVFGSERISSLSPQIAPSSPATLSFAKPRLVAKSTPGVRDSSPGGLGTSASGGAKNVVEAQRAVWNKNQPPPTNSTKEMTDEELKKNFGIHLASRLQSEDIAKEPTWADEDDDDDWVPETIEWNDGTKVALQVEATNTTTSTATSSITPTNTATNPIAPTPPATVAPPPKSESKQGEPKTLVFTKDPNKGVDRSDRGIRDAPQPRTSPWATLPPPNVVPLSNPRSESRASESGGPVHTDDFNRSWRDRSMNNQLYNSQTGQLEPVRDQRGVLRGSKPELQLGKTQVLQRPPSQLSGPAEPSPAFQQSRSGAYRQDDYRRRRTSSNVSGGSGSIGRRLSFNKGIHGLEHPLNPEDHAYSPQHVISGPPTQSDPHSPQTLNEPPQTLTGPPQTLNGPPTFQSATITANAPSDPALTPSEDPIAMQARIMKEARELARKRRLEEEAREEAAKKERLRVKLEALEKEAAEKAAKAAAEAAVLANPSTDVTGLAPNLVVQNPIDSEKVSLNSQTVNSPQPFHNNNNNNNPTTNNNNNTLPFNPPPHSLQATENHYKSSPVPQPSHTQPQSLASVPYRPGSFGNRSPTKKFSTIQPSTQSSLPPTNTYTMPIRDPRYDSHDPSGDRYANQGRFPYHEGARWQSSSSSRASPYGSIGDRAKSASTTEIGNGVGVNQQPASSLENSGKSQSPIPAAPPSPISEVVPRESTAPVSNITVQPDDSINKAGPMPPRVQAHQTVGQAGRHNPSVPTPVVATNKPAFNPWASYPEQLQHQEREHIRLAREARETEKLKGSVATTAIEFDYQEDWRQRRPANIENTPVERSNMKDELHKSVPPHLRHLRKDPAISSQSNIVNTPAERSNMKDELPKGGPPHLKHMRRDLAISTQSTNLPNATGLEQATISKRPSSPPPPEFCPVTALDINSDEDSQNGLSGVQPKKFIPHVRLPPQPLRSTDSRPTSALDSHHRPEPPKSDVTRYDRVLGNIMKTIEVSKGQQSSPSATAPAKFSETKPVFTDERETQQQSLTTVSLPPRVEETPIQVEPEDICTNDEEEFLQRLYVQEFGSQPTVKIPVIYSTYIPQRTPSIAKSKKTARPKGLFAETVPYFEVVENDPILNEQGWPFITVKLGPEADAKTVLMYKASPRPPRTRESRKSTNHNNNNNNNRKSGGTNGFFKKDSKPFLSQRQQQRIQSPGQSKPSHIQAWERQQQHPVVQ